MDFTPQPFLLLPLVSEPWTWEDNPFAMLDLGRNWAASVGKASRNVGGGSRILSGRQILGFSPFRRAPRPGDRLSEFPEQPRNQDSEKNPRPGSPELAALVASEEAKS